MPERMNMGITPLFSAMMSDMIVSFDIWATINPPLKANGLRQAAQPLAWFGFFLFLFFYFCFFDSFFFKSCFFKSCFLIFDSFSFKSCFFDFRFFLF
jgi:hypothetical protein